MPGTKKPVRFPGLPVVPVQSIARAQPLVTAAALTAPGNRLDNVPVNRREDPVLLRMGDIIGKGVGCCNFHFIRYTGGVYHPELHGRCPGRRVHN